MSSDKETGAIRLRLKVSMCNGKGEREADLESVQA